MTYAVIALALCVIAAIGDAATTYYLLKLRDGYAEGNALSAKVIAAIGLVPTLLLGSAVKLAAPVALYIFYPSWWPAIVVMALWPLYIFACNLRTMITGTASW